MQQKDSNLVNTIRLALWSIVLLMVFMVLLLLLLVIPPDLSNPPEVPEAVAEDGAWQAPDSTLIPETPEGDLIRYGRELVAHTSIYLGPNGTVSKNSNGMTCQNCHLKAGKKSWGINYAAVASTYPKFRPRSGMIESVEKRVNDCFLRSLNGQPIPEESREMKALVAYIHWVGSGVEKGVTPSESGIADLPVLDRGADPQLGKLVYASQCARCHGEEGQGVRMETGTEWKYPPLWGENSFNNGAGLLRLSRMAGFVHKNMPNDIIHVSSISEEQAWDVAAFICSQPRPTMDVSRDFPDPSQKPFDHPFGPYADGFSEAQHRLGPFGPIVSAAQKK